MHPGTIEATAVDQAAARRSKVVIVDYGMGNVASIRNMFAKIGVQAATSDDPEAILAAPRLVLPGVGAFDEAMRTLRESDLVGPLMERATSGRGPLLGVCLGMQLLLEGSDEGTEPGLGLIPGRCFRFPASTEAGRLKVPHMGWNEVREVRNNALLPTLGSDARYYFVHSYFARPDDDEFVIGTTPYGITFASAIARGDVVGVQFHPEKSHRHGLRLLADFARG